MTVTGLHIDESIGSPTIYEFMLTVVDYRNLTDNDTVFIFYRKGTVFYILPFPSPPQWILVSPSSFLLHSSLTYTLTHTLSISISLSPAIHTSGSTYYVTETSDNTCMHRFP